jgi:hypothetical protein
MSADVERSQVALVTLGPEPTVTPALPRPTEIPTPANGSKVPLPSAIPPGVDAPDHPHWRLAAAGYLLLAIGFALALTIPHLHLHAGIREVALVVLCILILLTATATILASFVLNLLRS